MKTQLSKPILITLYGFPGSGKTQFARKLSESIQIAYLSVDRIRNELFEKPRYDKAENAVVEHLMLYMAEEFLAAGVSVIYDANAFRKLHRRRLRELATKTHAKQLIVWLQIDADTAFTRLGKRDKRKVDDKYSRVYTRQEFDTFVSKMQHPGEDENYIVLSGKHSFAMQRNSLLKKFFDLGLMSAETVNARVVKPGLVNLIPAHRANLARRNISIRSK